MDGESGDFHFARHEWELILANAEASLSQSATTTAPFDLLKYLGALEHSCCATQESAEVLHSPSAWYDACRGKTASLCHALKHHLKCHTDLSCPLGHCVAIATAAHAHCCAGGADHPDEIPHHLWETWVDLQPSTSPDSWASTSEEAMSDISMHTRLPEADTVASQRAECRALLLSTLDDVHVQLLRHGVTGKRTHIGRPPAQRAAPQPAAFEFDDQDQAFDGTDAAATSFVWIDVVGSDWLSNGRKSMNDIQPYGSVSRLSLGASDGFVAFRNRVEGRVAAKEHAAPATPMESKALERALLINAMKRPRGYQSEIEARALGSRCVQDKSIEALLVGLEEEFQIRLPLASIARRVLHMDPSPDGRMNAGTDRSGKWGIPSSQGSALGTITCAKYLRQKIEEGFVMSYWTSAMFQAAEIEESSEEGGAAAGGMTEGQQHVIVLHTGTAPIGARQAAQLLPPSGSEQRSDILKSHHQRLGLILSAFLEQHERVHGSLSGSRAFSEKWVMFIDPTEHVVITIRPQDSCVVVGRIHSHFTNAFCYLPFDALVGTLVQSSVLHYRSHVDYMYTIIDEVQQFLAPSTIGWAPSAAAGPAATETKAQQQRRRQLNIRFHDPHAHTVVRIAWAVRVLVTRFARSAWRKIRRKNTRPRDITFAALRLLNLVNREAAVFQRALTEMDRTATTTRAALTPPASRDPDQKGLSPGCGRDYFSHSQLSSRWRGHHAPTSLHHPVPFVVERCLSSTSSSHSHSHGAGIIDDYLQDTLRIAEETRERCAQLRHLSSELMSLAMALDAETYDENLAFLGMVTALFAPMSYWCTQMGVNFADPTPPPFLDPHGYAITWLCFLAFSWAFISWFLKGYHNFDLNRWIRWTVVTMWRKLN